MAKIGFDDAFEKNFRIELEKIVKLFKELGVEARELNKAVKASKTFKEMSDNAKKAGKSIDKLTKEEKELLKINKQTEAQTTKLNTALSKENIQLQKTKELTRRATIEAKKHAKAQLSQTKSTNTFKKALGSFAFKFNALGNIAANVFSKLAQGLKTFIKGSLEAYDKQIKAEKALFVAMEGRIGATRKLIQQAQQLQKVTLFGDEETIQAQSIIAALVDEEEAIRRIIPLVQDMAQAKGMDLAGAADLVSKTLGSSTNAMSRYGIEVTGAVGSTERLDSLTRGLTEAFGGQAQAAALVDAQFTSLKNTIGDIQESIGGFIADSIFLFKVQAGLLGKNLEVIQEISIETEQANRKFKELTGEIGDSADVGKEKLAEALEFQRQVKDQYQNLVIGFSDLSKKEKEAANSKIINLKTSIKFYRELIPLLEHEIGNIEDAESARLAEQAAYDKKIIEAKIAAETKEREALNKAYAESVRLINAIKPPEDVESDEDGNILGIFDDPEADKRIEDANDKLTDALIANAEKRFSNEDQLREKQIQDELRVAEEIQNIKIDGANVAFDFLSALSDRKIAKLDEELKAGIISEEKAAKEKAKIQKRAAILDKLQSLFNIAINTAVAVTKTIAQLGPLAAPIIPFIIGLGAAQAAVVLATPIPKFAKGTASAPGGAAVVGEKGSELMVGPDGQIGLTPDSSTLMDIEKGTQIYPSDVTKELLGYTNVLNGLGGKRDEQMIMAVLNKIDKSNDRLYRAVKDKPVSGSTMTPAGILTAVHKGNTTIKNMKKYFK